MLHRSKSKDRASATGPSYMSSDQVASYLKDLRSYQSPRPSGARPPPAPRRSIVPSATSSPDGTAALQNGTASSSDLPARSSSALSHRRTQSAASDTLTPASFKGRPLVPTPLRTASPAPTTASTESPSPPIPYVENGMRWMERQEAHSLRRALEDMDLTDEERIHRAAQAEAAELVWKHQNPESASAPYRYRDHLRKGSYTRSHSIGSTSDGTRVRDFASKRSVSGSSSGSTSQPNPRELSSSSLKVGDTATVTGEGDPHANVTGESQEAHSKVKFAESIFTAARRRSSGSGLRKASGSSIKGLFADPNDKIYEEPEETSPKKTSATTVAKPSPVPARRNPFARVHLARANATPTRANTTPLPETKKLEKIEIQKNEPSQSRDPSYVSNEPLFSYNATPPLDPEEPPVKTKNGKEVRGDDIRAATSMKLVDRSAKLPTPVLVSDSPGRPIVSFKEPKTIELTESAPRELPRPPQKPTEVKRLARVESAPPAPSAGASHTRRMSNFSRPHPVPPPTNHTRTTSKPAAGSRGAPTVPSISVPDSPTVPDIQLSTPSAPDVQISAPTPPSIAINYKAVPSVVVNDEKPPVPSIAVNDAPQIPSISVDPSPDIPTILVDCAAPPVPTISVNSVPPTPPPTRPLPTPKRSNGSTPSRPRPGASAYQQQTKHISLAQPVRSSALCATCALPIAGRIVAAAGARFHPECFKCHHCSEALECVAFYPEPEAARDERLASASPEDHDPSPRFFCHLDFHELFSPRCRSCKTPIEGAAVLACGATWHPGHFFCAQCGDPFDAATPFVEKEGYAWCVGCHTNRFSNKCRKCKKPVVDTVVRALGAEWHEACFRCGECAGEFVGGTYFIRQGERGGGNVVCQACEERRLKA